MRTAAWPLDRWTAGCRGFAFRQAPPGFCGWFVCVVVCWARQVGTQVRATQNRVEASIKKTIAKRTTELRRANGVERS
jgi:hypothetical protein